jgi:hypothetical protein
MGAGNPPPPLTGRKAQEQRVYLAADGSRD